MTKLLDTSVLVDCLRRRDHALAFIDSLGGKPSVSVATVQELYAGAESAAAESNIEVYIRSSFVLPATIPIARSAGQHMRHYASSHGLDDLDAIIAATAEHHDLKLATLNVKHFPMFARLKRAY